MELVLTMAPPPLSRIRGGCRADAQEWAGQVDRKDPVPVLQRSVQNVCAAQCDTGIVHQDMQRAEFVADGVDDRRPVALVGDVQVPVMRIAARIPDGLGAFLAGRVLHVRQDDACPVFGQQSRFRCALSALKRRACDERGLVLQLPVHRDFPLACSVRG